MRKKLIIVIAVLFAWAVCGTATAIMYYGEYKSTVAIIEAAGGDKFVELVKQHGDSIVVVLDDVVAVRTELQSAVGRTAELEQRIERATGYAKLTDAELIVFGNTMASSGNTLQDAINLQQRTIEFARRIQKNNSAITLELGVRP